LSLRLLTQDRKCNMSGSYLPSTGAMGPDKELNVFPS